MKNILGNFVDRNVFGRGRKEFRESLSFEADEETHRIVLSSYDLVWKRKAKICSLFKMSGHK